EHELVFTDAGSSVAEGAAEVEPEDEPGPVTDETGESESGQGEPIADEAAGDEPDASEHRD
ncbi:MAG: hypothetical protein ABWY55_04570, partial [Microbacterium sp.]